MEMLLSLGPAVLQQLLAPWAAATLWWQQLQPLQQVALMVAGLLLAVLQEPQRLMPSGARPDLRLVAWALALLLSLCSGVLVASLLARKQPRLPLAEAVQPLLLPCWLMG